MSQAVKINNSTFLLDPSLRALVDVPRMSEKDERHDVDGQMRRDALKSGVIEQKQIKHEHIEPTAENSPLSLSAAG